jgi:uncharacterized protein YjbJ (UPF0337 family)
LDGSQSFGRSIRAGGVFAPDLRYSLLAIKEGRMGFWDKLMGRGKKTAGDAMDDSSMRAEGMHQEKQALAEDRAESAEQMAQEERERAAEHQVERDNM